MRIWSGVVLGLCVGLVSPVQAGYEDGQQAYKQQNYSKALKEFRAAAARKNAAAEYMLGMMYAKGEGVTADDRQAAEWLRKGAEHGNADAQLNYGLIHLQGRGVPQSNEEAIKWYRKAAAQGQEVAQYALTVTPGGVQTFDEAIDLLTQSADKGFTPAQARLGFFYTVNISAEKGRAEAEKWLTRAAQQKDDTAQEMLKTIEGLRVPGITLTSYKVQSDVWSSPQLAKALVSAQCHDMGKARLLKTAITKPVAKPVHKGIRMIHGEWSETWTVDACGKQRALTLHFEADGEGGATFTVEDGKPKPKG